MKYRCVFIIQVHYNEGDYIIRQAAPGDTFYIIASGKVSAYLRHFIQVGPLVYVV